MNKRHDSARADYDDEPERKPRAQVAFGLGLLSLIALGTCIGSIAALPVALGGLLISRRALDMIQRGEISPGRDQEHLLRLGKTLSLITLYCVGYLAIAFALIVVVDRLR
jgi:hypothetical protein